MASRIKKGVHRFFDNFMKVVRRPDMILLPGNLAFFFVLAIVPAVSLITYIASILSLNTNALFGFIENNFSAEIANLILGVSFTGMPTFKFIITIIIGLYIASNGADCIITTSNAIYEIKNKPWILRRIKAIGMTFMIIFLFLFMLLVTVFGHSIMGLVFASNLKPEIADNILVVFKILEGPVTWLIIFMSVKLLYSLAPDKKNKNNATTYGAMFTTIMWIIGTSVYSYYATNFASYTALYGGLANIVILMIWVYYLSYIFTVGIALNNRQDQYILEKTGTIKTEKIARI